MFGGVTHSRIFNWPHGGAQKSPERPKCGPKRSSEPNSSSNYTRNMALRDLIFFKYTIGNYSIGPPRGPHRGFHRGPQRGSLGGSRGVGLKSTQKGQNGCKLQNWSYLVSFYSSYSNLHSTTQLNGCPKKAKKMRKAFWKSGCSLVDHF